MTDEEYRKYLESPEWKKKAKMRLQIDGYTCVGCGCRGSVTAPLQVHHLDYKDVPNEDIWWSCVSVCPSCHNILHNVLERITDKDGSRGWHSSRKIPHISTYTLSGLDRYYSIEKLKREE